MRSLRLIPWSLVVFAAASVTLACDDDPSAPDASDVVGEYAATTLTTTENGVTTDWIAEGATIDLNLLSQGTTTGRMFIPDDSEPLEADLAGTWALNGSTVSLQHAADTFLRDMPLTAQGNRLTGDATFGGTRVRLTLTKQ